MQDEFASLQLRPTWATIDHAALQHNVEIVRASVGDQCGILAMIKADAYGHGAIAVARSLEHSDVVGFGVATLEEALELRKAGITKTILTMGGLTGGGREAAELAIAHNITCVIHAADALHALDEAAQRMGQTVSYHLKVDTGMGRMGVQLMHLPAMLKSIAQCEHATLAGVMSHLACADDPEYTREQIAHFSEAATLIMHECPQPLTWHLGLSSAIINCAQHPEYVRPFTIREQDHWWVRPGIMLYGIAPFPGDRNKAALQPAMSLHSHIALIRTLPAGSRVSYGGTWTAPRESRIATIPIGYADGYPWRANHDAHCLINGTAAPIVGRITMDLLLCDVSDIAQATVGDQVTLFGDRNGVIRAEDLADLVGTSPYEVVCRISKRVPRIATQDGQEKASTRV